MRWLLALSISILMIGVALPMAAGETSDDEIRDTLMIKLAGDRDIRGTQITVAVESGEVTLEGEVFSDKARKRAEKMAKKHKGVKKVVNNLTVPPR